MALSVKWLTLLVSILEGMTIGANSDARQSMTNVARQVETINDDLKFIDCESCKLG